MTRDQSNSIAKGYRLKIHLVGASPMVWRRLLVPEDTSIAKLHGIIQIVMGWGNEHLHYFKIHGKDYGIGYSGGMMFSNNLAKVLLKDFRFRVNTIKAMFYLDPFSTFKHNILFSMMKYCCQDK